MLSLSRLFLVVLLGLHGPQWSCAELLPSPARQPYSDHKTIGILSCDTPAPKDMSESLVACDSPIFRHPADLQALLIVRARASITFVRLLLPKLRNLIGGS
jgi:hypothetical protein